MIDMIHGSSNKTSRLQRPRPDVSRPKNGSVEATTGNWVNQTRQPCDEPNYSRIDPAVASSSPEENPSTGGLSLSDLNQKCHGSKLDIMGLDV